MATWLCVSIDARRESREGHGVLDESKLNGIVILLECNVEYNMQVMDARVGEIAVEYAV